MIRLASRTINCLRPADPISTWDWVRSHLHDKDGRPFNSVDYPWTKKIFDSWDDPGVRTIWLQFAARLGKSLTSQACVVKSIVTDPSPAMVASSTKDLVVDTIKNKMWPMLMKSGREARSICPPKSRQHQQRMDLASCRVYSGWSGSPTTLGDKDPRFKWGYEIDKWSHDESDEADPLELYRERGAENIDMCEILESTPTIKGRSRVNRGLLNSTNERFLVPCPECGEYSQLIRGEPKSLEETGGLLWDKPKEGENAATIAARTVRYLCRHCHREWKDENRRPAIRKGVWCPEGCIVNAAGEVEGEPIYEGPERGFQLGRLYAPTFTFADHARHWVITHDDPQNHINSWDGDVYEMKASEHTWETLGARLAIPDHPMHVVPEECSFLTTGVDVQAEHLVFFTCGWGSRSRGWLIDWGYSHSWDDLTSILSRQYRHEASNHETMWSSQTLIDCRDGNRKDEVINYCKSVNKPGRWVFPCMGTISGHMSGKPFLREQLDANLNIIKKNRVDSPFSGFFLIKVNTHYWQEWIQRCIDSRRPEDPLSLALPKEAAADKDMLSQLINEGPSEKKNSNNRIETIYTVIDETQPWDFRDAARYSRCGAEVFCNGNWARVPEKKQWIASPATNAPIVPARPKSDDDTSSLAVKPKLPKRPRFIRGRRR